MVSKSKFKAVKRKNGLLQAYYYVNLPDGTKKREVVYDRDKKSLEEKWEKAVADNIRGESIKKSSLTVASYFTDWINSVQGLKPTTIKGYRSIINVHIIPNIGNIRLSSLTIMQVQKMMNAIIDNGGSTRATNLVKIVMSKALKPAEADRLVNSDIMRHVKVNKYIPRTRQVLNADEIKTFVNAIKCEKYRFIYMMCLTYGLRRGEAIALKWEDVDLENMVIHIRRGCIVLKGGPVLSSLKTSSSYRDLPIMPHIKAILEELPHESEFILSDNGKIINPDSVSRRFKVILKNAGLPNVVLHSLRHFAATGLKNANVSVKDTQTILGHSTPITTLKYYQHTNIEEEREAMQKYLKHTNFV